MGPASSTCATAGWSTTDAEERGAATVLVADHQPEDVQRLLRLLTSEGYRVDAATSAGGVLDAVDSRDFDAVLVDLTLARDESAPGRDLLKELASRDSTLPVVVMSSGSGGSATGIPEQARDVIQKPWDDTRLLATVRTQVRLAGALRQARRLAAENEALRPPIRPMLVADAPSMKPVVDVIARVAASSANVLITGESGTGKATVAQSIHALSARASGPFIAASAAAAEGATEHLLFGAISDTGTPGSGDRIGRFELADGGTLFLEDVAALTPITQSAFVRAVESGEFERVGSSRTRRADVRVISSSVASLRDEVAGGRFRQDLLLRLGTIEIALPPLRSRREDIPALAHQFLRWYARQHRRPVTGFEHAGIQALLAHEWPGNIRELDHAVERGVLMAAGPAIRAADLGLQAGRDTTLLDDMSLEHVESFLIGKALARFDGNVSRAAKALGLSRSALYRRLQRYGL